jgi:hypothetical protein
MVYINQNSWVFGLCPSSGILETKKHNVSETGCFCPQMRGEDTYSVAPLRKSTGLSDFFYFLEYRTMNKVQKLSYSESKSRVSSSAVKKRVKCKCAAVRIRLFKFMCAVVTVRLL